MKRQLVVMARWPAPGRCKQRLATGLGNRRAAAIQQRLCAHTLATVTSFGTSTSSGPELVLAVSDLGQRAARRWADSMASPRSVLQGPGALGVRMQRQFLRAWREGVQQVVLIGSDLPSLEAGDLEQAFALLAPHSISPAELVLGPARDGGYWLIGLALNRLQPSGRPGPTNLLLAGIPWGTNQVLPTTLERASQLGLRVALLQERSDVDWPNDLTPWR